MSFHPTRWSHGLNLCCWHDHSQGSSLVSQNPHFRQWSKLGDNWNSGGGKFTPKLAEHLLGYIILPTKWQGRWQRRTTLLLCCSLKELFWAVTVVDGPLVYSQACSDQFAWHFDNKAIKFHVASSAVAVKCSNFLYLLKNSSGGEGCQNQGYAQEED